MERCFKRTNVPSTLLVSLEDELEMVDPIRRDRVKSKSFLIPAGMNLEVDTHGANVLSAVFSRWDRQRPRLPDIADARGSPDGKSTLFCGNQGRV
ncbi:MAG: hypothetical protein IPH54_00190 [Rhodoferax sp.]|nr:hypothetical protein [Rhodoferax sp.]